MGRAGLSGASMRFRGVTAARKRACSETFLGLLLLMLSGFSPNFGPFEGRVWLNCAHQAPLPNVARIEAEEAVAWKAAPWELTTERFSGIPAAFQPPLSKVLQKRVVDRRDAKSARSFAG
jgi:hypothetical protein